MELMLEIISRQKFSPDFPVSHVFSEAGGFIGRSEECEWILPDKGKRISRKHAVISCDGQTFFIEDVSRNGIFTEPGRSALQRGVQHKVEHGDSFTVGVYTFQARLLHRPDTYIGPQKVEEWLIPDENTLSSDPLAAMEQQEAFEARRRLGYHDDLLGEFASGQAAPDDHASVATDSLLPVAMVPDHCGDELPEDWDCEECGPGAMSGTTGPACKNRSGAAAEQEPVDIPDTFVAAPELDVFFKTLGYSGAPDGSQERERILRQAAEIVLAAVDGLHHCLRNQAECKNDLRLPVTTMRLSGNNPLKFTPTSRGALEHLLGSTRDGMLPAAQAVAAGFDDLHGHHMGLLAGARASVRAVLDKISPKTVETQLDCNGRAQFARTARLWHLFRKKHQSLLEDHEGFAALFLHDFARAYEVQVRTLRPLTECSRLKGDS